MQVVSRTPSTDKPSNVDNKDCGVVTTEQPIEPSNIFLNERVWAEDYIPDSVPYREEQIEKLNYYLHPILRKCNAANVLLLGQFGTGKTVVARHVINKFMNKANVNGANVALYWVNASKYTTNRQQVTCNKMMLTWLREMGKSVYSTMSINISTDMMEELTKQYDNNIFVIDEVDEWLKQPNNDFNRFAYLLSRSFHNSNAILITNKYWTVDYLMNELDARTIDTFSRTLREIGFSDYGEEELLQILKNRAEIGLKPTAYTPEVLKFISDLSYRQGWKARGIIQLVNWAGVFAEKNGYERLEPWIIEHVGKRKPEREFENMIANLDPPMFTVLRMLIKSHDQGSEWVREKEACEWFMTKEKDLRLLAGSGRNTFINALGKLKGLEIVRSELMGRGRGMGTYVRLQINHEYRDNVRNVMREFDESIPNPKTASAKIEKRWEAEYKNSLKPFADALKENDAANGGKATGG